MNSFVVPITNTDFQVVVERTGLDRVKFILERNGMPERVVEKAFELITEEAMTYCLPRDTPRILLEYYAKNVYQMYISDADKFDLSTKCLDEAFSEWYDNE